MTDPLERFRRDAKQLKTDHEVGDAGARERVAAVLPHVERLKHADYLHVIARENTYLSWPAMKAAVEVHGLDRATKLQRLKIAIHHGQTTVVERLLDETPDLAEGQFGLLCALYDRAAVALMMKADPSLATADIGAWSPLIHLCKSRMHRVWPDRAKDAMSIASMLVEAGADLNAGSFEYGEPLSPLYWALGYAGNLTLAKWLLEHGATPDDNESLYHATELGTADGVRLLLQHGVTISGTNALKRAMDFDNLEMVQLLLGAGADPNEGDWGALHHAALRMSSAPVCQALIDAGANPKQVGKGVTAYAAARVYGNAPLAKMMAPLSLSPEEALLARAADGDPPDGAFVDPAKVPELFLDLVLELAGRPEKRRHLEALIKIGMPWDRPNGEGLTPVQIAGWQGQPEMMAYFLSLKPDMGHINGYGGTLFSTILHGSENNPSQEGRDYVACLKLAFEAGVALPRKAINAAGRDDVRTFLSDWAAAHPGQVVAHGVV